RRRVREPIQKLPLLRYRPRELCDPIAIHIDVASPAQEHAAASRRHPIVELAQHLHDPDARLNLEFMLHSITIDDTQQRHSIHPQRNDSFAVSEQSWMARRAWVLTDSPRAARQ